MSKKKDLLRLDGSLGKVRRRYKGYAAAEEQKRKIVLYAGAVMVAVLMVMLAAWGIGTVVAEIIAPDEKVTATSPMEAKEMTEEDAMNVLVLKLDDEHNTVESMVITRFDPVDSRVYVAGLSPRIKHGDRTLGEYFIEGGAEKLAEAVAELVDCDKVFTISVDYVSTRKVINIFGGITLTIPYAIKYDSPNNDRNLNVAPGTREYTGWEIARLLNYPDWNGGEQEQLYMYATVVNQIINEKLYYTESVRLRSVLNRIYDEADSDITMTDFQRHTAGLLYLCSINGKLAEDAQLSVIVDVWPDEQGDGTLEYSGDNLKIMCAAFGRSAPAED